MLQNALRTLAAKLPKLNEQTRALIWRLAVINFVEHRKQYAVVLIATVIASAMTVLFAWIMKDVVNKIFVDRNADLLFPLSLSIVMIFVVKGFATYIQQFTMMKIGNRIVAETERRAFGHVLGFGVGYFTSNQSGDLIVRITGGARSIRDVLHMLTLSFGRDLMTFVGLVGVMVSQAPVLSLIAFVIGPFAITGVSKLIVRIREFAASEFQFGARAIQIIQETVQGIKIVKAFNLDDRMRARMDEAVSAVEGRANEIARLQARTSPLMETLGGVAIGSVMAYAGWSAIHGTQTPGEFMAFTTALLLAYEPAKRLARLHVNLGASMVGVEMLFKLLDTPRSETELPIDRELKLSDGLIEFRNVEFEYRPGEPVLRGIDFSVAKNRKVALVGPSGGGKTTILCLIARFYDVNGGEIAIDGQDIRSVSADSVRRHISFVSQDTYLFGGSIRDNIRTGRLDATDDEIEQAARAAYAHDFIMELPNGYDTGIGENGVQLSGGQRQRIAIARAMIKNAPILLLDEATSALDSASERQVQQAFDGLMRNRTIVVIAHRLSTVRDADQILVIDRGRIVERGTHEELVRNGDLYESLCAHQFQDRPVSISETSAQDLRNGRSGRY